MAQSNNRPWYDPKTITKQLAKTRIDKNASSRTRRRKNRSVRRIIERDHLRCTEIHSPGSCMAIWTYHGRVGAGSGKLQWGRGALNSRNQMRHCELAWIVEMDAQRCTYRQPGRVSTLVSAHIVWRYVSKLESWRVSRSISFKALSTAK